MGTEGLGTLSPAEYKGTADPGGDMETKPQKLSETQSEADHIQAV